MTKKKNYLAPTVQVRELEAETILAGGSELLGTKPEAPAYYTEDNWDE